MIDYAGITTVFLFMLILMGAAAASAIIVGRWESKEMAKEIQQGFDSIRQRLKGHL